MAAQAAAVGVAAAALGYGAPRLAEAARDYWQQKVRLRRGAREVFRVDGRAGPSEELATAIHAALLRDGCCIVEGVLGQERVADLLAELHNGGGGDAYSADDESFYGSKTQRGGPHQLGHSHALQALVTDKVALGAAERVLQQSCKRVCLKLIQTIAVQPGQVGQVLHREDSLWPLQDFYRDCRRIDSSIDALWALTDFTAENGATWLVPGSHRWGRVGGSQTVWQHRFGMFDTDLDPRWCVQAEMTAGSCLLFSGGTIHAAAANHSEHTRRGLIIGYNLGWLKPENNFLFANSHEQIQQMDPKLQDLLGYAASEDNHQMLRAWMRHGAANTTAAPVVYTVPPFATAYHGAPEDTDSLGSSGSDQNYVAMMSPPPPAPPPAAPSLPHTGRRPIRSKL